MHPAMKKILFLTMALIFLLSACGIPAAQQPTQNATDIANQVATSVALTVAAQNAQTQAAASLVPQATNTMLPTQTLEGPASPTAIIPTVTPIPTLVPSGGGGGGGGTTVKPKYACNAFPRTPRDGTIFKPNDSFDIKWTIVNTGTKPIDKGTDVKYNLGTKLSTTLVAELPELKPGDSYVIVLDAVAPAKEGKYTMAFAVEGGLCYPYTTIEVVRP